MANSGMANNSAAIGAETSATGAATNLAQHRLIGSYWSSTEDPTTGGAQYLFIGGGALIRPNEVGAKTSGRTLRCVRNL
jgi:hypothetical protein